MPVIPSVEMRLILDELTDVGNALDGAILRLYQNDLFPSVTSVFADFDVATFTGYANSAALVWGAPYTDVLNNTKVQAPSVQFTQTGILLTNVVYGWFLTVGTSPAVLVAAQRLDVPFAFDRVGAALIIEPVFSMRAG